MATEQSPLPVNGNYQPHQALGYGTAEQNYGSYTANQAAPATAESKSTSSAGNAVTAPGSNSDVPKSEVGWYFVEQYYKTLSLTPEKLHLFYNKRSQFVSGEEAARLTVCIGREAIHNRIKELDFQDCKIRVTNVDSQASDKTIVIQVIGEISIKSKPHRKFVETFILAEQTNGYFVLNDIFRYILDEEEEGEEMEPAVDNAQQEAQQETQQDEVVETSGGEEPPPTAEGENEAEHSATLTSSEDPVAQEEAAQQLHRELEEKVLHQEPTAADAADAAEPETTTNGVSDEHIQDTLHAEEAPVAAVNSVDEEVDEEATEPSKSVDEEATAPAVEPVSTEEIVQPEKPKVPPSTPTAPSQDASVAQPEVAAAAPPVRKTWANLVAGSQTNRIATPAVAAPAPSPAPAQSKPAPTIQTQVPPAVPQTAPTVAREASPPPSPAQAPGLSEWQTAGHEHGRRQNRPQAMGAPPQNDGSRAYIKNVSESLTIDQLKSEMQKYGEVIYCDINRQKNCGFVDFINPPAFQAALAANPHQIGDDTLYVEERRLGPAPGRFNGPFIPRGGGNRGRGDGRPGGGRGGFQKDGGRGGFGGRGDFVPRGRGGAASRGRGAPQPV